MKIRITMKDPDGVGDSVNEFVRDSLKNMTEVLHCSEMNDVVSSRTLEINEKLSHWLKYQEYVTLEIDLENDTCHVVRVR